MAKSPLLAPEVNCLGKVVNADQGFHQTWDCNVFRKICQFALGHVSETTTYDGGLFSLLSISTKQKFLTGLTVSTV